MTTRLFVADTLLDAVADGASRPWSAPVPARTLPAALAVFPRPIVREHWGGEPIAVVLDLRAWLIHHTAASTLPLACDSQRAAEHAAAALATAGKDGAVDPTKPAEVAGWARAWCELHRDAHPIRTWGWWQR
ncbi:hypothetical protein GCM10012275_63420 [Longimycelium tulufanense]|uniref:Uncharacterized protein n=1 Tax=Longimycelium tulufanense TaxID=907463 RepID=A0A8J3FY09_9PSEU|nr:hypothetical protein [Longimycelium tulufanense]GGM84103.1 hypothetical protein GCM10012275_63420 [Longimycelium tulufanense]